MALSNHERVTKAMNLLKEGLEPFVEREMEAVNGEKWMENASRPEWSDGSVQWDAASLLLVLWENWNSVFGKILGYSERSLVSELREWRNKWAHQNSFTTDDTHRVLDSAERLLTAISASQAEEIGRQKRELIRIQFEEQTRRESRKAAGTGLEGQPMAGLKPWREVVTPHRDVASGDYQQAEFAADLNQVYREKGVDEYRDPAEFFRRTFLTEGLRMLLTGALRRMAGLGGDPVIELQTNFGGGKTHSQLALYHLFSGIQMSELTGIDSILQETGIRQIPAVRRAVLVGTAISPAETHTMSEGVQARTLWGIMASQLLGKEGYALVAEADRHGVSPGSDKLAELFQKAAPCLILIDEWIAFVRQLNNKSDLPAGSFEANLTFAQALTEAAKAVPRTLLVASIPSSDIEVGGDAGKLALDRLKNTFGRLEAAWRPASAEEGFEIARRRLFEPILVPELFTARDAVARAFMEFYRNNKNEFPAECAEAAYEKRIQSSYPIHPELFDRLYQDWCSLDKFQRTRGVLRLMAAVIHALWEGEDKSLLILPASVPINASPVQFELTRYMEDSWIPVIEKDVDGPHALPLELDSANPNLGRYSACRRVARTLYIGSAPTLNTAQRGLEERRIKLGCVQAGESAPIFGNALRHLADQATHLYVDGQRYWFSTQPSVAKLARERAQQCKDEDVEEEIKRQLREQLKASTARDEFAAFYIAPASSGDVPDEREARLALLGPEHAHVKNAEDSGARREASAILVYRGNSQRIYRNSLVFLAPDLTRLDELQKAVRGFLAWKSIEQEKDTLNLDVYQSGQAVQKKNSSEETVKQLLPEAYQWLLIPSQPDPRGEVEWQEIKLQGSDGIVIRAGKKLISEGLLVPQLAGTMLRREMDKIPLWPAEGNHISVKLLADYFASYLYLPRLKSSDVLLKAIADGLNQTLWHTDTFGYADSYDEEKNRYVGLRAGMALSPNENGLLVRPEAALKQMDAERLINQPVLSPTNTDSETKPIIPTYGETGTSAGVTSGTLQPPSRIRRRFHGSVILDPIRLIRDMETINKEALQHLVALAGSKAEISLEISIVNPDGFPEDVERSVSENCKTLKFISQGFEEV